MAMLNRFGIKQPDNTVQYYDLGVKSENVSHDGKTLVNILKELNDDLDKKYSSAGGVVTGEIVPEGGLSYVGKAGYIAFPQGGKFVDSLFSTGQLKIILPNSWDNVLIKFKISIANLKENSSVDYFVSGYMSSLSNSWENCSAVAVGKYNNALSNLTVRFGHNDSQCVIAIGETNTSWDAISIMVSDVNLTKIGGADNYLDWARNWSVLINANNDIFFTKTIEKPHVAEDIKTFASTENANTLQTIKSYVDQKIADLIDDAPETLDTLREIANEISDNQSAIDAINTLIATKVDKTDFNTHVGNTTAHVTLEDRNRWDNKQNRLIIDSAINSSSANPVQNKVVYAELNKKVNVINGMGLSTNDFTSEYLEKLEGIEVEANKYIHPDSGVIAGEYKKVKVDIKGHVIEGNNDVLTIAEGGTGATTASEALSNLGFEATTAELNILKGVSATTDELNYLKNTSGNIQTQLDRKASLDVATQSASGLMSPEDKKKLDGITNGANDYIHPSYDAKVLNLYKVSVDGLGHINDTSIVTKEDIVALGIPSVNSTYTDATQEKSGLMSSADKKKLDEIDVKANAYVLPMASTSLGGVKTTSSVSSALGYTACPIINGVVYYKTYGAADSSSAGLMTSAMFTKLDNIAAGAEVNVQSDWNATSGDAFILNKPVFLTGGSQTTTSTEDEGINTYTFTKSDGTTATLTVKNGSKGSVGPQGFQGVAGPKGDIGATGPQGPKGDKGDTGSQGPKGDTGPAGENGITPTIKVAAGASINAVGTPTVSASTSGTTTTFTFNYLKGEKGDKGDKGDKGPVGATGSQGPKGDTGATGPQGPAGTNATTTAVATTSANGLMSAAMVTKLNGIATGANAYTHPSTHAASMITEGTFAGTVIAPASTTYTTNQLRNGVFTTTDPGAGTSSSYANGSLIYVYE